MIKHVTALLALSTALSTAAVAAPPVLDETLKESTAGAILVSVGESPEAIIFVSKTGKVLAVRPDACQAKPECAALVDSLATAGHISTLQLKPHYVKGAEGAESV